MIAFRAMLVGPAEQAGIKVPPDLELYDSAEYPHWGAFLNMQLGRRMPCATSHWDNAKIIAAIPDEKIKTITVEAVMALGYQ